MLCLLERASDLGSARAMREIGLVLQRGRGLKADPEKSAKWLHRAAATGDAIAMRGVAMAYASGFGVPLSATRSTEWMKRAAEAGDVKAMRELSSAFKVGFGVSPDQAQAERWAKAASTVPHGPMRFAHLRRSVRRPLGGQSIGRDRWLLLALPLLLLALPVETAQATSRAAESAETEEAPPNPAQPAVRRPAPRPAAPRPAPAAVLRPPQPAPQPVVNVPPCFPRLLLPPSGRDAKPEILGTMDPVARANYMQAIHLLHCETGRDVEALALLKDGAKVGFRPSIRALGSRIIDDPAVLGEEAAAYLKIFTKEANAGSASAANLVGVMMDGGIGTKADPVGAGKFYRAAAADGSQRALEWLAYASATGRGTRADRAGAQRFHARLERDRGVRAARDIVVALELGREGKRDEAGARFWADALRSLDKDGEAKVAVELEKAWRTAPTPKRTSTSSRSPSATTGSRRATRLPCASSRELEKRSARSRSPTCDWPPSQDMPAPPRPWPP